MGRGREPDDRPASGQGGRSLSGKGQCPSPGSPNSQSIASRRRRKLGQMIPVAAFSGKNVAVFGLGGSGRVTAAALIAGGARVAAWDDNGQAVEQARTAGLPVVDLAKAEWKSFVALVLSPGVPLTHPKPHWTVERAREAGIEVIGDVELFVRERRRNVPGAPFIAITGTNGKSTTTALIAHLIAASGRDAQLGGNIGRAILS